MYFKPALKTIPLWLNWLAQHIVEPQMIPQEDNLKTCALRNSLVEFFTKESVIPLNLPFIQRDVHHHWISCEFNAMHIVCFVFSLDLIQNQYEMSFAQLTKADSPKLSLKLSRYKRSTQLHGLFCFLTKSDPKTYQT